MNTRETITQEAKAKIINSSNKQKNTGSLNQEYNINNVLNHLIKHSIVGAAAGGLMMAGASMYDDDNEEHPGRIAAGAILGSTAVGLTGATIGPAISYWVKKMDKKLGNVTDRMFKDPPNRGLNHE